ncbi:alpha/beta fold hydrolase [Streptomyces polyrhachis]|uniref:Alpha/beta fold hydrolase n=1 Tax=Streptomyces polyrhachis TaxID=1282885 RepID=A0ABW2GE79_9ACTN
MADSGAAGDGSWAGRAGIAGAAIGVVAAGAAAGIALERLTVGRGIRRKARMALDAASPYGALHAAPATVRAEDGTELHYEVEEVADHAEPAPAPLHRRVFSRKGPPPLTVVFCHGYCLNQDAWHFQRLALRGRLRTVYWDQRSHGRSGRGPAGAPVTIEQLGRDLRAVLDAAVPEGPVVLVGHSMGGMTVMALAAEYPDYVTERVAGVAFVGTSAGGLEQVDFGLPLAGMRAVRRLVPGVLKALGSSQVTTDLVERGRRATADLFAGLIKRYSFDSLDVDPALARFAERLIESTPIDVVADFYPALLAHDKTAELAAFAGIPALVLVGEKDLVTPASHSEVIAAQLPDAEHVVVPEAGHLVLLERPEAVQEALSALLERAATPTGQATKGRQRL